MASEKVVLGIFDNYTDAAEAVDGLKNAGFLAEQISLLGRDTADLKPVVSHLTKSPDPLMSRFGIIGAVGGFLVGLSTIAIPGVGALLVAGPLIAAISGAAAGGAIGVVAGALVRFDVPETEARIYETHLTEGRILLAVHTQAAEQRFQAEEIMDRFGAIEIDTKAA
jgi:hypothetical protein